MMFSGQFQAPAALTPQCPLDRQQGGPNSRCEHGSGQNNPGNGNSVLQSYITQLTDKFFSVSVNIALLFMSFPVRHDLYIITNTSSPKSVCYHEVF